MLTTSLHELKMNSEMSTIFGTTTLVLFVSMLNRPALDDLEHLSTGLLGQSVSTDIGDDTQSFGGMVACMYT